MPAPNNTQEELIEFEVVDPSASSTPKDLSENELDTELAGGGVDGNPADSTLTSDEPHDDDENDEVPPEGTVAHEEGTDPERQAIRERRRQERQEIKRKRQEREETMRRELASRDAVINQMRQELDAINRRNSGSELAQLQNAQREAENNYAYYKDQIRIGAETNNGTLVAEATEQMLKAQQRYADLKRVENVYKQRQQTPPPLDPRMASMAESWTKANTWYDVNGRDADSRIVATLDQSVAEEGFDPTTKAYWDELDSRIKKYLPHRAKRATMTPSTKPKSVVAGSSRESSPGAGKSVFRLSPERAQAIKDAGAWDDPVERNKMIKAYQKFDKENGSN